MIQKKRSKIFILTLLLLVNILINCAFSQNFPNKEIIVYCNFDAGGATDLAARALAIKMTEVLGVPVIVENKGGGGGSYGPSLIALAKPDGYTIGTVTASPITSLPYLQNLPYHPIDDLSYMGLYANTPHAITVKADSPFQSLPELVDYAKEHPDELTYGTVSAWSIADLAMRMLCLKEEIDIRYVPFGGGGAEAMMQLLGGHVDVVVVSDFASAARAGEVRLLAEIGSKKIIGFEEVPTLMELGYGFEAFGIAGFIAPKDTPVDRIEILSNALKQAVEDPETAERLIKLNVTPNYVDPVTTTQRAKQSYEETGEILRAFGQID